MRAQRTPDSIAPAKTASMRTAKAIEHVTTLHHSRRSRLCAVGTGDPPSRCQSAEEAAPKGWDSFLPWYELPWYETMW